MSTPGSFDFSHRTMSDFAGSSSEEEQHKSQEKPTGRESRNSLVSSEKSLGLGRSMSGFTVTSRETFELRFADALGQVMENNFQDNSQEKSLPTRVATPLHWAVAESCEEIIDLLIEFGADINALDNNQRTPLICAANINSVETFQKLVRAGADTSFYDAQDYTALVVAAQHGNLDMISNLENDNMFIDVTSRRGGTILHALNDSGIAAPKMFSHFLSKGADPHRHGMSFCGPITGAFRHEPAFVALGVYMLNTGLLASVDKNDKGNPLSQLISHCGRDLQLLKMTVRFLKSHNMCGRFLEHRNEVDATPLCNAAIAECMPGIDFLLGIGADINKEGCFQGSPLMAASHFGRLEAVKMLFRNGALTSYASEEGLYRNAFTAGRHHRRIIHWFLVGRFQDQNKLAQTSYESAEGLTERPWSGSGQIEWRLTGDMRQRRGESGLDYFCRVQRMKTEARGLVVV